MKREFKTGDRVAVYDAALELFGSPATVQGLLPEGRLYAKLDQPNQLADTPRLHSKQCRRLVKKQRRSVWVMETMDGELRYGTWAVESKTTKELYSDANRWVEFREVKRK